MSSKAQFRIKMALYVVVLILAELLQTAVFGELNTGLSPAVMPVAVSCIALFEGAERGGVFGLVGGCLWAWATALTMYGAYVILILTVIGAAAGLITERFLLRGIQTALCITIAALFLTDGLRALMGLFLGTIPGAAIVSLCLPQNLIALLFCPLFYAIVSQISRIGGLHG